MRKLKTSAVELLRKKQYYKTNRLRILAYRAKLRSEQPEKVSAIKKKSYQRHRVRHCAEKRTYYQENRELVINRTRDHSLKIRGLAGGFAEKQERWEAQNGRCALCGFRLPKDVGKCHTDHSHETGRFRGLVHARCNILPGWIENHPGIMEAVEKYLG